MRYIIIPVSATALHVGVCILVMSAVLCISKGRRIKTPGIHKTTCTIVVSHLKGTAIVYKPHVLRRCLSSQGTSMYPRVHEGCWATVASQNCETISGHYKSYYGTSHLYHGFLRCMGFVPEGKAGGGGGGGGGGGEDIQLHEGTNPIHLETHGTNITCTSSCARFARATTCAF